MLRAPVYLVIFFIPAVILLAAIEWVAATTGAVTAPSAFAAAQAKDPNLIVLPPSIKYYAPLKLARIAQQQPDVVFIGTSRCAEFRSAMFLPYRAFNSCLSAWTLDQYADVLRRVLAVSHPKVVIVALDYFLFTDTWEAANREKGRMQYSYGVQSHLDGLSDVAKALVRSPEETWRDLPAYLFAEIREPIDHQRVLGLDGIRAGAGFRYDGSFLFPAGLLAQSEAHNRDVTYGLISAMPGGLHLAPRQIAALRALVDVARESGVTLVGVQLPYLKTAVDYLDTNVSYHDYAGIWREFEDADTRNMLASLGIHFFDLSRDPLTADSRYFIDAAHPNEAGLVRALVHLADDPDFHGIFPKLDDAALKQTDASVERDGDFFHVYHGRF